MLTELRETVAEAEEVALRDTIGRRVRLLTPADGPRYTHAVFAAYDSKLGMDHADYLLHDVELHEDEDKHEDEGRPTTVDLDDDVLSAALGTLAGLLRPEGGADLTVDLTGEGNFRSQARAPAPHRAGLGHGSPHSLARPASQRRSDPPFDVLIDSTRTVVCVSMTRYSILIRLKL
ncbi:hypothetical protein ACF082_34660 [Streptomyces lydicus]|uniref:hypothetical protein n=1 Tax=Streptomyces lydicus TaxID=47763 RepID=UPI0036FA758E